MLRCDPQAACGFYFGQRPQRDRRLERRLQDDKSRNCCTASAQRNGCPVPFFAILGHHLVDDRSAFPVAEDRDWPASTLGTGCKMCMIICFVGVLATYGCRPVSISKSMTPNE